MGSAVYENAARRVGDRDPVVGGRVNRLLTERISRLNAVDLVAKGFIVMPLEGAMIVEAWRSSGAPFGLQWALLGKWDL
jgi:hypothetical protein